MRLLICIKLKKHEVLTLQLVINLILEKIGINLLSEQLFSFILISHINEFLHFEYVNMLYVVVSLLI